MTSLVHDQSFAGMIVASDDKTMWRFNSEGESMGDPTSTSFYVTSMSLCDSLGSSNNDQLLAVGGSDGNVRLMRESGAVEKTMKAHEGAVIQVDWSPDGLSLATSGEDGTVKIWSKTGNLRTKLVAFSQPVYAISWGADDDSLVVTNKNNLSVHASKGRAKVIRWEAQPKESGVVLAVDWNHINNLIISGGEDCCFRIFDSLGLPIFASAPHEHVITSVSWAPNGTVFAVGSFNVIRLCDKKGWGHSHSRLMGGSIMDMKWSPDGTQIGGVCGDGTVFFAHLLGRKKEWGAFTGELVESDKITVLDNSASSQSCEDDIEFSQDPVVEFSIGFNHLVACTKGRQCYIYRLSNLHSRHVLDLEESKSFVTMSATNFLLAGKVAIAVYSYDGRFLCSPRFQGLRPETLSHSNISISPDTLAVVDHTDKKIIRLFDVMKRAPMGESMAEIEHDTEITKVSLSQYGPNQQERRLIFIDRKNEMFMSPVTPLPGMKKVFLTKKICTQVDTVAWNDKCDILAAVADTRLITWLYPNAPYVDNDLLELASETKDGSEFGTSPTIIAFHDTALIVRREDGMMLTTAVTPFPAMIYDLVSRIHWVEAVRMCRFVDSSQLWATLSGLALQHQELGTAVVALSAINKVDKMQYLKYIQNMPSGERQNAELLLYRRCSDEAVSILLQARPPLLYRAIKVCIRLFQWEKALDIAVKRNSFVEIVLWYRKRFLSDHNKVEENRRFIQLFDSYGELDKDQIQQMKENAEKE